MITAEVSIQINRPVEQVFSAASDFMKMPEWDPSLLEVSQSPAGPLAYGTQIAEMRRMMGVRYKNIIKVVECKPNARFVTKSISNKPLNIVGTHSFSVTPTGTQFKWRTRIWFQGFWELPGLFMAFFIRRAIRISLRNLKRQLEAPLSEPTKQEIH